MLVVEPVRHSDLDPVARIAVASLKETYNPEWLAAHAAIGSGAFLVARDVPSNQVVGFALAQRGDACDGHLLALAVDRERRGQGVGSALLKGVRDRMVRTGAMQLELDVRSDDMAAQTFYTRHGFTPCGLEPQVYSDGSDAVRMVKPL